VKSIVEFFAGMNFVLEQHLRPEEIQLRRSLSAWSQSASAIKTTVGIFVITTVRMGCSQENGCRKFCYVPDVSGQRFG
jgi:hypothetical protein